MNLLILLSFLLCEWPGREGQLYKLAIVDEHQAIPTYDTILAVHWHKVNDNKFYIILPDSTEKWVDNVTQIKK